MSSSPIVIDENTAQKAGVKKTNLRKYYNIVRELAIADFRMKYHDSALGYIWSMLNPLFMFLVLHFVFSYLFVTQVYKFTLYLLSGIVFWNFFVDATASSMGAIQNKSAIAKRIYFPRILIVFASNLTALISFCINSLLLLLIVIIFDHVSLNQLLTIIPFISIILLSIGISLCLCILFIYFRDMLQIWNVLLSMGFWLTPIVYDALTAPPKLKTAALLFNPVGRILVMVRCFLVWDIYPSIYLIATTTLLSVLILLFGIWFFQKNEHKITEFI